MTSEIRLLVKNAGQAKDFPILLANTATVGDLKGELQRSYPSHPNPAQQKLIFAGRLLNDDAQSLAQLITTSKYDISATQTVHLVLPPTLSSSTSGIPSPTVNRIQAQPELRRSAPAGFGSPVAVPHQLPAIHGQPHPRYVPGNGMQPPFARPAAAAIPDGPAFPQPAAAPAPPAPAQPQQPAGPGFLGRQNWMLMLKLVVIIYIFSQGGGSTRLAILSFGAFVIYLYHMGLIPAIRFTLRRAAAAPVVAPAEQRVDDQPQQQQQQQQQGEGQEAAPAVAAAATTEAQPPAVAAAQRVGLWRELENLFLPFVYSLAGSWPRLSAAIA